VSIVLEDKRLEDIGLDMSMITKEDIMIIEKTVVILSLKNII